MNINTMDDVLLLKAQFNQKMRKKRILIYRKSKLKLREENKQKTKLITITE